MNNPVIDWFGKSFAELHPMLQDLHRNGGELTGTVNLEFGSGISGVIGRKLAAKLGLPSNAGNHDFKVLITHKNGSLYWSRQFDLKHKMVSVFTPHGNYPTGYWSETTGKLSLILGVKIFEGGWHWVQRKIKFMGISMPLWLFPSSHAYKQIKNEMYEFSVTFKIPVIGKLLSYSGKLLPQATLV